MYLIGAALVLLILWEAFETIILPRRVPRRLRLTRLIYRAGWLPYSRLALRLPVGKRREAFAGYFGPFLLLLLLAFWAVGLIVGFALVQWSLATPLESPEESTSLGTYLYLSGVSFFTLGLGDVVPLAWPGRVGVVVEAGVGFGFLAMVIGYLPVLYQAFSRREVSISLLDSRAGSPPSASEFIVRHMDDGRWEVLDAQLRDWERWAAELLESHLSYPLLCYFRSQHDNQSWISALTAVLDACALEMTACHSRTLRQTEHTFAMARHAVVDLAQVFDTPPKDPPSDRLSAENFALLAARLRPAGIVLEAGDAELRLSALRRTYEPYANALGEYLLMPLPPWVEDSGVRDNWQSSAWDRGD